MIILNKSQNTHFISTIFRNSTHPRKARVAEQFPSYLLLENKFVA